MYNIQYSIIYLQGGGDVSGEESCYPIATTGGWETLVFQTAAGLPL